MTINSPFGCPTEMLKARVSTRIGQHVVKCETKTKDNVFCHAEVTVQYRLNQASLDESAVNSVYKIQNFAQFVTTSVQDIVRTKLSKFTLDQCFAMKHELTSEVEARLGELVREFGYVVEHALITSFMPSHAVVTEMNNIYTQTLLKQVSPWATRDHVVPLGGIGRFSRLQHVSFKPNALATALQHF